MNTFLKISTIFGFLFITCIIATIIWGRETKDVEDSLGHVVVGGIIAFIFLMICIVAFILGFVKK